MSGRGSLVRVGLVLVGLLAALLLAGPASAETVARVIDGDTIVLGTGQHVRLVQIDSTELGSGECYSRKAAAVLRSLLPVGSQIRLEADPALDHVDRYGRLLRYVFSGGTNVNLELVRRGAATVWFYDGARGRYAAQLLDAMRAARADRLGMWRACRVVWNPEGPATAYGGGSSAPPASTSAAGFSTGGGCNPNYRPCLPIVSDLDCADIPDSLKPVHVIGSDPYHLDGDGDGLACEAFG